MQVPPLLLEDATRGVNSEYRTLNGDAPIFSADALSRQRRDRPVQHGEAISRERPLWACEKDIEILHHDTPKRISLLRSRHHVRFRRVAVPLATPYEHHRRPAELWVSSQEAA